MGIADLAAALIRVTGHMRFVGIRLVVMNQLVFTVVVGLFFFVVMVMIMSVPMVMFVIVAVIMLMVVVVVVVVIMVVVMIVFVVVRHLAISCRERTHILTCPPLWGRFARESSGLPDRGPPQAVGEVL